MAGDCVLASQILRELTSAVKRSRSVPSRVPTHRLRAVQVPEATPIPLRSHTQSAGDCKGAARGPVRRQGRLPSWAGTPQGKRPGRPPDPRSRLPRRLLPAAAAAAARASACAAAAAAACARAANAATTRKAPAAGPPPPPSIRRAMSFEALATWVEDAGSVRVAPATAGRCVVVSLQEPMAGTLIDIAVA